MKSELNMKKFLNCLAFVAICFAALGLLIVRILGWFNVASQLAGILSQVANAFAYIVTSIAAYSFVRTKRSTVWMAVYIVAVILIAVCLILPIFLG